MGLFSSDASDSHDIELQKIKTDAFSMNLIRIIDWEAGVVLYTDTTREGYTSVPISETDIDPEDHED